MQGQRRSLQKFFVFLFKITNRGKDVVAQMKSVPQPTSENKNIIYNKHKKARYVVQAISGAHAGWSNVEDTNFSAQLRPKI